MTKRPHEKPGTLGLLIHDYRASPTFQDLAPQTQSDYQKIFDYLRPIADTPLRRFDRPLVVRIRDKAAASKGRRFGNYVKAVLSLLFAWGSERGFVAGNPASGIKDIRRKRARRKRTGRGLIKSATPFWTRHPIICVRRWL